MTHTKTLSKSPSGFTNCTTDLLGLTTLDLHLLNAALMYYARNAYGVTGNINHTEAVENLSDQILDIYCEAVDAETTK